MQDNKSNSEIQSILKAHQKNNRFLIEFIKNSNYGIGDATKNLFVKIHTPSFYP